MLRPGLTRTHITSSALAMSLAVMHYDAAAFGSINYLPDDPIAAEFKALDKNHDGHLSHDEASHDADIAARFDSADLNHDKKLSEDEFAKEKNDLQQAHMKLFLDDSTITARVKADLVKDIGVRGLAISVETHRGQVILSGFVDNDQQIRRAAEIASGVRGVLSVKNSLLLKG